MQDTLPLQIAQTRDMALNSHCGISPAMESARPSTQSTKRLSESHDIPTRLGNEHGLYHVPQARWIAYSLRKHVYDTKCTMAAASSNVRLITVEAVHPNLNWTLIWRNLHTAWIADVLRSEWYVVIHGLLPTNDLLYTIVLMDAVRCHTCGQNYTTGHRILKCGEGRMLWRWTRARLAMMLRTSPDLISSECALRLSYYVWPAQRHGAVLWILAHFVHFRVQYRSQTTFLNYADFMRRTHWKVHHNPQHQNRTGNYLSVLQPTWWDPDASLEEHYRNRYWPPNLRLIMLMIEDLPTRRLTILST
jgi:hypothetical protein